MTEDERLRDIVQGVVHAHDVGGYLYTEEFGMAIARAACTDLQLENRKLEGALQVVEELLADWKVGHRGKVRRIVRDALAEIRRTPEDWAVYDQLKEAWRQLDVAVKTLGGKPQRVNAGTPKHYTIHCPYCGDEVKGECRHLPDPLGHIKSMSPPMKGDPGPWGR